MPSVERFCIKCGKDRAVDALSFRCLTCGMQTKHVTAEPQPPQAAPSQQTLALPPSGSGRKWMQQTQALADSFAKAADKADATAKKASAEAERLRRAAAAFRGLLSQVSMQPDKTEQHRRNGQWSRLFDACVECGTTEKPHAAKGRCRTCQGKKANRAAA